MTLQFYKKNLTSDVRLSKLSENWKKLVKMWIMKKHCEILKLKPTWSVVTVNSNTVLFTYLLQFDEFLKNFVKTNLIRCYRLHGNVVHGAPRLQTARVRLEMIWGPFDPLSGARDLYVLKNPTR